MIFAFITLILLLTLISYLHAAESTQDFVEINIIGDEKPKKLLDHKDIASIVERMSYLSSQSTSTTSSQNSSASCLNAYCNMLQTALVSEC